MGTQPTNVLYQDGFSRGTSFNDVVNASFGGGGGTRPLRRPSSPRPVPRFRGHRLGVRGPGPVGDRR